MKKFVESLIEKAKEEGAEVHVIHMSADEPESKEDSDPYAEAKEAAEHVAILNQIMYQAHINAGFTKEEALALTVAVIEC